MLEFGFVMTRSSPPCPAAAVAENPGGITKAASTLPSSASFEASATEVADLSFRKSSFARMSVNAVATSPRS